MQDKKLQEANAKLQEALDKVQKEAGMKLVLAMEYGAQVIKPVFKWVVKEEEEKKESPAEKE